MNRPSFTNRRQFIKKSALGAGAAALASSLTFDACAQVEERKLGIALVGLGRYSTNNLAPALQETSHCELKGIVTGTPEKAEKWSKQYNIPDKNIYSYDNYDEIANNPDIDIIYVVLPNSMHAEYSIRASQAGKHVICEKPMAISVKECEDMIAAAKAAKKSLHIGYRLHYEPFTNEIMRFQREGVLGNIKVIEGEFGFRLTDKKRWRLDKKLAGGGPLMDVGIYVLQAAQYATGEEPIAVTARAIKTEPEIFDTVEETLFWTMEFPSGAVANCTTTYATSIERLRVNGDKGWCELSPAYSYGPLIGKTNQGAMELPIVTHQAVHMDGVSQAIKQGVASRVPGEMGLRDMKIIEGIYTSMNSGERVALDLG